MPYLYQSGEHHPGVFTLETSRSAAGPLAALASLLVLGRQGFRTLLGHSVAMAQSLAGELQGNPAIEILNPRNPGPVTLFRARLAGKEIRAETADERRVANLLNRRLGERLRDAAQAGRGVLLSTTIDQRHIIGGEPLVALKSFALSPFCSVASMREVAARIEAARIATAAEIG
jgi:glutamate/tyrosine decarboxylase-like PLP-dependent enzyme